MTTMLIEFNNQLKFPFENCYHTPNTLGEDRLALAAAGFLLSK